MLAAADEVVLIDLTPEALIERLRDGKIYPAERIEASLNNFFRIENLATLRELALRQVAEEVEAKQRAGEAREPRRAPASSVIEAAPAGGRRAGRWRWSPRARARSGWCAAPGARPSGSAPSSTCSTSSRRARRSTPRSASSCRRSRKLASVLGARMMIEEGDDVAEVAAAVGAERGTTYVLIGQPPLRAGLGPAARVAARAADPQDAGRRRADRRRPGEAARRAEPVSRILFPFMGSALSERTLDATLRLARAQEAMLMPAYVDRDPADALARGPLGAECDEALALLEADRAARGPGRASRSTRGSSAGAPRATRSPS